MNYASIIFALAVLPLWVVAGDSSVKMKSEPRPKPIEVCFVVKSFAVIAANKTAIDLVLKGGDPGDGVRLVFIKVQGAGEGTSAEGRSNEDVVERFLMFEPLPGGTSSLPGLVARHFGLEEVTLFSEAGWWAGVRPTPEKLASSGGSFWLHEGQYPAVGYVEPAIRLGVQGIFERKTGDVTLKIWRR